MDAMLVFVDTALLRWQCSTEAQTFTVSNSGIAIGVAEVMFWANSSKPRLWAAAH